MAYGASSRKISMPVISETKAYILSKRKKQERSSRNNTAKQGRQVDASNYKDTEESRTFDTRDQLI